MSKPGKRKWDVEQPQSGVLKLGPTKGDFKVAVDMPKAEDEGISSLRVAERPHRMVTPRWADKPLSERKRPHVRVLLGNAQHIIHLELERLNEAAAGPGLSPSDSGKFAKYVDALAKLAREEREQDREDDPSEMNSEDLKKLVKELIKDD